MLDRSDQVLSPEGFIQDLLAKFIWEDYGFTHQKQPDFFASLTEQDIPVVEVSLSKVWRDLGKLNLTDRANIWQ